MTKIRIEMRRMGMYVSSIGDESKRTLRSTIRKEHD
jgi:hypothetical protein